MSDKQPWDAIKIADWLENSHKFQLSSAERMAAAELRRLHALCDEMGKALQKHRACVDERLSPEHAVWARELDAVLAKWKESK